MPAKGKEKGTRFEILVAERLSHWWGNTFKRTPNSGALRWRGVTFTYGDILPPEDFPCVIECKHYREVNLDRVIRAGVRGDVEYGFITYWWFKQIIRDVKRCLEETDLSVHAMLVYRMNNRPIRLGLSSEVVRQLCPSLLPQLCRAVMYTPFGRPFTILDFEQFLDVVPAASFLTATTAVNPRESL